MCGRGVHDHADPWWMLLMGRLDLALSLEPN
jgi:hypothetical protein